MFLTSCLKRSHWANSPVVASAVWSRKKKRNAFKCFPTVIFETSKSWKDINKWKRRDAIDCSRVQKKRENHATFSFVFTFDSLTDGVHLAAKNIQGCKGLYVFSLCWITNFFDEPKIRGKAASVHHGVDNWAGALTDAQLNRSKRSYGRRVFSPAPYAAKAGHAYGGNFWNA